MIEALLIVIGLLIGGAAGFLFGQRTKSAEADRRVEEILASREAMANQVKAATADALRDAQMQLAEATKAMREADSARSQQALKAREDAIRRLTDPINEAIRKVHEEARRLGEARTKSEQEIRTLLQSTNEGVRSLRDEAGNLTAALRGANTRGQWGEMQLRRCLEIGGMTEHVDFVTQGQLEGDGGRLRPDAIVHLPSGRHIVIDSKVALDAYLDATTGDPADRDASVRRHAEHMRKHVMNLASKEYKDQFARGETPDFVVMFTPEASLRLAHEVDPGITEYALERNIIITTPVTLIALLKTIALGWREETLAKEAQEIANAARELHKRVGVFARHFENVGKKLDQATSTYNEAVGSFQRKLVPQLRRIEELKAGHGEALDDLPGASEQARELVIEPELLAAGNDTADD